MITPDLGRLADDVTLKASTGLGDGKGIGRSINGSGQVVAWKRTIHHGGKGGLVIFTMISALERFGSHLSRQGF